MATNTPKRLCNIVGTGADATPYTAPGGTTTIISSILICNRDSSSHTFRVGQTSGSGAIATTDYLYFDVTVQANDSFIATMGAVLVAADTLHYNGHANTTFQAWGVEVA